MTQEIRIKLRGDPPIEAVIRPDGVTCDDQIVREVLEAELEIAREHQPAGFHGDWFYLFALDLQDRRWPGKDAVIGWPEPEYDPDVVY